MTPRILIVEDVPDVARHLRGLVAEQRDLELLDIVRDGATALARLQELAPDVVVVDSLVRGPVQLHEVLAALRMDKKYAGGVRFVLLESPGHPRVVEGIDEGDIRHAYRTVAA